MRKYKKDITKSVHLIEKIMKETNRGKNFSTYEQLEVVTAIYCTLFYLDIYDSIRGDKLKEYFTKKYLSLNRNMTQVQLARICCICVDSVSNYCNMYIDVFNKSLTSVQKLLLPIKANNADEISKAGAKSEKATDSVWEINVKILITNLKELLL